MLPCKSELSVRNLNFILYKLCAVLSSDRIRHFFPTPSGYDPFLSYDHTEKVNRLVLALKILRDYTGMILFVMHYSQTPLSSAEVLVQISENQKEPLRHNTGVMALVFFWDSISFLSKGISLIFKLVQNKVANVLLKFSDLKPLSAETKWINQ